MIEINLIPDVKLELLNARRQRKLVISASIVIAIVAASVVVLLAFYAFGVQTVTDSIAQANIDGESKKLKQVKDLSKTLTIQNQLSQIDVAQRNKTITSRIFDIVNVTKPQGANAIVIKRLAFDDEQHTLTIEGDAAGGYETLEVFKKTIVQTKFQYEADGKTKSAKIVDKFSDGERRYSEDAQGRRVLRFTQSFTFPEDLFSPASRDMRLIGPTQQRATDSLQGVPTSLFNGDSK